MSEIIRENYLDELARSMDSIEVQKAHRSLINAGLTYGSSHKKCPIG